MPEIDLAKVCFIIEKSREYLGEDVGVEADELEPGGRRRTHHADRHRRPFPSPGTDRIHQGSRRRRGGGGGRARVDRSRDMQPEEWKIAVAQAKERAEGPTWKYLLEMELLPDYLEDALSAFGRSCEGFGSADEGCAWPRARNLAGKSEAFPSRAGESVGRPSIFRLVSGRRCSR